MADGMLTSFHQVDRKTQAMILQVFSIHNKESEIMAIDIATSLKPIDDELMGKTYAIGMAAKIMADASQEWLCRQPDCSRLIKATHSGWGTSQARSWMTTLPSMGILGALPAPRNTSLGLTCQEQILMKSRPQQPGGV